MPDREKVKKALEYCDNSEDCRGCVYWEETLHINDCPVNRYALELLKEQEAEIRQLRLALDIAKGTCKGIKSGGGQFADMPTMQSAT